MSAREEAGNACDTILLFCSKRARERERNAAADERIFPDECFPSLAVAVTARDSSHISSLESRGCVRTPAGKKDPRVLRIVRVAAGEERGRERKRRRNQEGD